MSWLSDALEEAPSAYGLFSNWDSFTGKSQQSSANETNVNLAREQMAFQERMSSSAHQREVKDLEASGINPILSAKLGGASSPSGSLARVEPMPSGTNRAVSSGMDALNFAKDMRLANSQSNLNDASSIKATAEADSIKGGAGARIIGTDMSNSIRKVLGSVGSGAKADWRNRPKTIGDFKKRFSRSPLKRGYDYMRPKVKSFLDRHSF